MLQALTHKSPPTPQNINGGDTPRAGAKRVQPPFTPMRDASPPFMLES